MGFIMEYVIRSNNPWLVLLLVAFMLIAAVQITLSRAKGVPKGLAGPVFLSLVVTMLIMISLVTELIIRPQPWYAPQLVVPLTGMLLGNTVSALAVGLSRFFESMKNVVTKWTRCWRWVPPRGRRHVQVSSRRSVWDCCPPPRRSPPPAL